MKMIFYYPNKFSKNPKKGSEIRPIKMLEAFQNIGYDVELVVGNSFDRKSKMNQIISKIQNGVEYEFVYLESDNMTFFLSDNNHFPSRPFQDIKFFEFLKKNDIPSGVFYRDLYWRVKGHGFKNIIKRYVKNLFHWLEWLVFKKTIGYLFLPSESIKEFLPSSWNKNIDVLYPGFELKKINRPNTIKNDCLKVLYVGGVTPPYYDLSSTIQLVYRSDEIKLTICCRKKEWEENKDHYKDLMSLNINIAHPYYDELYNYYSSSDIILDVRKPEGYLRTALPIKVIESMGFDKPLVMLKGTESSEFIDKNDIGWTFTSLLEIKTFLSYLAKNKSIIEEKSKRIKEVKLNHTWEKRALKVQKLLRKK